MKEKVSGKVLYNKRLGPCQGGFFFKVFVVVFCGHEDHEPMV